MARVTIEKCLKNGINDKFDLVLVASERSLALENGQKPLVNDKCKSTLLSLIELEEDKLNIEEVRDSIVKKFRKYGVQINDNEESDEDENEINDNASESEDVIDNDEDDEFDIENSNEDEEDFSTEEDLLDDDDMLDQEDLDTDK